MSRPQLITRRQFTFAVIAVPLVAATVGPVGASQGNVAGLCRRSKVIGGNFHRAFKEIWTL